MEGPVIQTADVVVIWRKLAVLTVIRAHQPCQGMPALPGGKHDPLLDGTDLRGTAARELWEETGFRLEDLTKLQFVEWYDDPERDPRGTYRSVAYLLPIEEVPLGLKAGSDAQELLWLALERLPPMAFDHVQMIQDARALLR